MKKYELVIEKQQPTCGGKPPKDVTVQTVTIDDPLEYVKSLESVEELEVVNNSDGTISIRAQHDNFWTVYTFDED